jgi:GH24 family phage-related lysozyme (muramidase)
VIDLDQVLDEVLIPHEGLSLNLYRDTAKNADGTPRGLATCAIGHMVPSEDASAAIPWLRADGSRATTAEARILYQRVMQMAPGLRASAYAVASPLRLTVAWCRQDAIARCQREFLPGLHRLFPGFDSYPPSPQLGLVDMIYNLGEGKAATADHKATGITRFGDLRTACEAGNWPQASVQSHVISSTDERNAWRAKMFLDVT